MEESDWGKIWSDEISKLQEWLTSGSVLGQLTTGALAVVNGIVGLLLICFIGLYGAAAPQVYVQGALQLTPEEDRGRAEVLLEKLAFNLRRWMLGHLTTMLIVGMLASIGLSLLNIPEALVLGLLAFCAELVPYLGPVLASLPAILMGWSISPVTAGYVVALYLGIHVVEGYFIYPWVMRTAVRLPPALTIVGIAIFGFIGGVLGAILATPLTLAALTLAKESRANARVPDAMRE